MTGAVDRYVVKSFIRVKKKADSSSGPIHWWASFAGYSKASFNADWGGVNEIDHDLVSICKCCLRFCLVVVNFIDSWESIVGLKQDKISSADERIRKRPEGLEGLFIKLSS